MHYRSLLDSQLSYPTYSPKGLPQHESFLNDGERWAMNWVVHQSAGVQAWEQTNRKLADADAHPPMIFEIGTFWGLSLVEFSRMVAGAQLHSLDVGPEGTEISPQSQVKSWDDIGRIAREQEVAYRQHRGSSIEFDYRELPSPIDVVFIDGRHDRQHVENDTSKTLPLLASGGVMVWHDYKQYDTAAFEMVASLNALDKEQFGGRLTHILNTSLVYWINIEGS